MSRIGDAILRSQRAIERDSGNPTFKWKANQTASTYVIPCMENSSDSSKILGLGGFALEADLVLFVRVEVLVGFAPVEKDVIQFRAKNYRLDKITRLAGDTVLKYNLISLTKGS